MKINDFEQTGNLQDIDWKSEMDIQYSPQMKTLTFKRVAASSEPTKGYVVSAMFLGVLPTDFNTEVGKIKRESLESKDVKVDCHCKAYIMGGCLKGNLENGCALNTHADLTKYKRVTDNPNLVRNAEKKPQLCKHLVGLIKNILDEYTISTENN